MPPTKKAQPTKSARRACNQTTRRAPAVRTLRSRPGSALIGSADASRRSRDSEQCHGRPDPASDDPLDRAQIVVSIEHTTPGSPLDEQLRREQTRALLDLLADHATRQRARLDDANRREPSNDSK